MQREAYVSVCDLAEKIGGALLTGQGLPHMGPGEFDRLPADLQAALLLAAGGAVDYVLQQLAAVGPVPEVVRDYGQGIRP